ncbi:MAG: Maf family protein, partial [Bacteroidota bacterium]|nr:Maf family protein [Candidatus Kapabacteria bacterium]MDW8221272.1 Maf family protein [Bacteroidota bacterium]
RVEAPTLDEQEVSTNVPPTEYVQTLARLKAENVAARVDNAALVIGADTTVVLEGCVLNKPRDARDAARMLQALSNRIHEVYTGITLIECDSGGIQKHVICDVCRTEVRFRELAQEEIAWYVATGLPLDKAGGYGIQDDYGAVFVESISGCYYNVVGLPLQLLYRRMRECSCVRSLSKCQSL